RTTTAHVFCETRRVIRTREKRGCMIMSEPAKRRGLRMISVVVTACLSAMFSVASPAVATAATSPGFDDDGPVFHIFWDCQPVVNNCPQNGTVSDVPSPSEDGQALQISYKSG